MTSGVDTLCYNHTLERVFQNRPGIAICNLLTNIQPFMIFNHSTVLTNFSQSSQSELTVTESFPSLLEVNGNILHGLKFHFHSSLKIEIILKLDTIKSTPVHQPDVLLEKISMFFYLSELTSREPLRHKLSFTDFKLLQTKFSEATHLSKFKSLTHRSMPPVLLSASLLQQLLKSNQFSSLILDGEVNSLIFMPATTCLILILPQLLFHTLSQST